MLLDEVKNIKKIIEDGGELDPTNEYHIAALTAYGSETLSWEYWDNEYGWQNCGMPSTYEMLGIVPAYKKIIERSYMPHRRKRMIRKPAAYRVRRIHELLNFLKWNKDGKLSISTWNEIKKFRLSNKKLEDYLKGFVDFSHSRHWMDDLKLKKKYKMAKRNG